MTSVSNKMMINYNRISQESFAEYLKKALYENVTAASLLLKGRVDLRLKD